MCFAIHGASILLHDAVTSGLPQQLRHLQFTNDPHGLCPGVQDIRLHQDPVGHWTTAVMVALFVLPLEAGDILT